MKREVWTSRYSDRGSRYWNVYSIMQEFCYIMQDMNKEVDLEIGYKETFRVFSKDEEGCIPADEMRWDDKMSDNHSQELCLQVCPPTSWEDQD